MTSKYGYKVEDWEAAKEEMRQILVERARLRGTIPYSDLVSRIETIRMEPDSFALAHMPGLTHHFFRAYAPLFPAFLRVFHGN